jgi:hypothetical protein
MYYAFIGGAVMDSDPALALLARRRSASGGSGLVPQGWQP